MSESILTLSDINDLRVKHAAGEIVTDEQLRAVVASLRQDRMNAKPQQRGKKAAAAPVSLFDLSAGPEDEAAEG